MDICLFGGTDFAGDLYFDGLALQKVGPAPLDANLLGPSSLGYKEHGTYTADVSRGSGDFTYQ